MNKIIAFIASVFIGACAYTWQISSIHLKMHGVMPSDKTGFLVLTFGIGLLAACILVAPIIFILNKYKITNFLAYMIGGSFSMGLIVSGANNWMPLQNPEGFIIGAMVGLFYWAVSIKST